jgi:superfamily II DNA helicase RecQ
LSIADLLRQKSHPLFDFEAQEHTAQVDAGRRQLLEQRFRYTDKDRKDWARKPAHEAPLERLPVMFCSPTMELGVDISALNTVYLRNVPPTPANYAQRSGRAGRSGQQALVITYCASLSPHDQWFFPSCQRNGAWHRQAAHAGSGQSRSGREPPAGGLAGECPHCSSMYQHRTDA